MDPPWTEVDREALAAAEAAGLRQPGSLGLDTDPEAMAMRIAALEYRLAVFFEALREALGREASRDG